MLAVTSGALVEWFVHPDATEITKTMSKMLTLLSDVMLYSPCTAHGATVRHPAVRNRLE
jgi:hypothetical protein